MVNNIGAVDITQIGKESSFYIDANVLLQIHASLPIALRSKWPSSRINTYSDFILELLVRGHKLYVSALNLQEVFHAIETQARKEYNNLNGSKLGVKDYRCISVEREKVRDSIEHTFSQIKEFYTICSESIEENDLANLLDKYTSVQYDPIDFIVVEHSVSSCNNFITHDRDFTYDSRVNVYCE